MNTFRLISFFISLLLFANLNGQTNPSHTYQNGYVKKNGKYVAGHHKTEKNKTEKDNFVSKPNTNPYNGKKGYKKPKK